MPNVTFPVGFTRAGVCFHDVATARDSLITRPRVKVAAAKRWQRKRAGVTAARRMKAAKSMSVLTMKKKRL